MVEQGHMGYIATGIRCTNKEEKAEVCSDYLNELKAVVAQARKERVDVLCLPELCVCKQGCLAMEEAMSEAAARLESDMMLVVAGSFHNPVAESEPVQVWKNEAPVWVVRSGKVEEVVRIAKTQPFVINDIASISEDPTLSELYKKATERECDKLVEDITPATTTTLIRTPVGLWGFLICLDALYEQETLQALRILADHVVIISMDEKGPADFRSFAMKQHKFHLSGVYYVNAAQRLNVADKPRDELHAAFWPPSRDLNEAERTAKEFVTDAAASANARSQKPPAEVCPRSENGFYVVRFPLGGIVH